MPYNSIIRQVKKQISITMTGAQVDAGTTIPKVNGQIKMRFINNTSGFMFEIFAEGGFGTQAADYRDRWSVLMQDVYPTTVTVTKSAENVFVITTPAPDNRSYTITFNDFHDVLPIFQRTGGAPIGAATMTVIVTWYQPSVIAPWN